MIKVFILSSLNQRQFPSKSANESTCYFMFPSAKITEKYSAWYCEVALNGVMKHGFTWRDRYHCLAGTDLAWALVDSMQKLLQAITVKPRRTNKFVDNPQYFCYRRPAYQLWIEKQKNPDCCTCCARAELIREVHGYLFSYLLLRLFHTFL